MKAGQDRLEEKATQQTEMKTEKRKKTKQKTTGLNSTCKESKNQHLKLHMYLNNDTDYILHYGVILDYERRSTAFIAS